MNYRSLPAIQQDIYAGKLQLTALVQHYLDKIGVLAHLNIYNEVFGGEALQQAAVIQEKMANGTAGKLAGMVIALKDNIAYKGHKVSVSSKILENYTSIYSATVVERLLAEDAIIIGRVNCDEFAMGSSNENSFFGPVKNPLNPEYVPGGSSGGSAAAVAAGLCLVALGSDTGGSIRQPSSFCGVIGLKPTYGRVSRYGLLAYASSFDQIGPITTSVEDAALVMEVMSGKDAHDSTSSSKPLEPYTGGKDWAPRKIAVLRECIENPGLSADVKKSFEERLDFLKSRGCTVEMVDFPYLDYLVPAYYVLTTAEASSNLARYDGIHFGYRSPNATDLESTYKLSRSEGFGKEVKRRIMLGTFVLSAGYYDAYYTRGQKVRRLLTDATRAIFNEYDLIATPTTPNSAFRFGQKSGDPVTMYLEDIFTVHANLAGIPAISVPAGYNSDGLPIGLQLMAPWFGEKELLDTANVLLS